MPFSKPSAEVLDQIATDVLAVLRKQDRHPLAHPHGMTFRDIERTAHVIGQHVAAQLTADALAAHADHAPETALCPKCQHPGRVTRKKRTLLTVNGTVDYLEPAAHCIECRCDFFPSAAATPPRRTAV